ncbi:GroES-like protein [Aureobasidium pullulans]|nr:GroES-like protein [Aureobasidium pullulans]
MHHAAVFSVGPRAPLELRQVPTPTPVGDQVRVLNEWTSTQPFDLHKADGALAQYPDIMGDGSVGIVVEVGDQVKRLQVGDKVFGYMWKTSQERGHQTYAITQERFLAKIPFNISMPEAATVPTNFVTVFHTVTSALGLPLPWPKPDSYIPTSTDDAILIWGGSSSVGQYALQILSYYGYNNLIAVGSARHHAHLKTLGASRTYDYNDSNIVSQLKQDLGNIPYFFDCIGSVSSSIIPIAELANNGNHVAILLPLIFSPPTPTAAPKYGYDVTAVADWASGVRVSGVRTHAYEDNEKLARLLQPEIMPALLQAGVVRPNRYRVIEGKDILERAENALTALREGVSGEKLVWRVADV